MSRTIPIAPLFFLPLPLFVQFWGGPKGTALFRFIEKETGVAIGISEKTLRKNILQYPTKPTSRSMRQKLLRWIKRLKIIPRIRWNTGLTIKELGMMRPGEADWRAALCGVSSGADGTFFTKTLNYIHRVLDEESIYFKKALKFKNHPEEFVELLYQEPFYLRYAPPISEQLLSEAKNNEADPVKYLLQQTSVLRSHICGCIALQMDILACAEVEWLSENFASESELEGNQSRLSQLLPVPMDDDVSVITPVERFFRLVRSDFGYKSWNDMAEHVPVEASADGDVETKRRKLVDWTQAKHLPKPEAVDEFLDSLIVRRGNYDPIYYKLLYQAAFFMNQFIKWALPEIQSLEFSVNEVVSAFGSFNDHFERHKKGSHPNVG